MDLQAVTETLGFDWRMALFSIINFFVVFLLLKKFLFGRIGKFVEDRKAYIAKSLQDAEDIKKAKENIEAERAQVINEANKEANEILVKAQKDAEVVALKVREKSQEDIEKMYLDAKKRIEVEKEEMIKEIKQKAAELSILATEKIIDAELDEEKDKKIINEYLDKLGA